MIAPEQVLEPVAQALGFYYVPSRLSAEKAAQVERVDLVLREGVYFSESPLSVERNASLLYLLLEFWRLCEPNFLIVSSCS